MVDISTPLHSRTSSWDNQSTTRGYQRLTANPEAEDPVLLREQCFIDGRWVAADNGGTVPVRNPATGGDARRHSEHGRGGNAARDRAPPPQALPAWAARTAKERADRCCGAGSI